MIVLVIVIIILAALAVLWLLAIRPNDGRQELMRPFTETYIAHRGLHTAGNTDEAAGNAGRPASAGSAGEPFVPENSLAAFRRAAEAGYGIELDVQLTADGQVIVLHDPDPARVTGVHGNVSEMTYAELSELRLGGTDERIPLFSEALALIGGRVPLVVEVKADGDPIRTAEAAAALLADHSGTYCVESFHPLVLVWLRKHCPEMLRGQLSTDFGKDGVPLPAHQRGALTNLLVNFLARPDFIAYRHIHKNQLSYRLCRRLYRAVHAAWTIRSQDELDRARDVFHVFIFEGFEPK
ncbi:MAG: glycerophosphodiester phosphodiesterase [Lachnospiraceae bacterium]|nr:glycerophosphodiester phosphodiesterase [Lachnospiraceae bacterium]